MVCTWLKENNSSKVFGAVPLGLGDPRGGTVLGLQPGLT